MHALQTNPGSLESILDFSLQPNPLILLLYLIYYFYQLNIENYIFIVLFSYLFNYI